MNVITFDDSVRNHILALEILEVSLFDLRRVLAKLIRRVETNRPVSRRLARKYKMARRLYDVRRARCRVIAKHNKIEFPYRKISSL